MATSPYCDIKNCVNVESKGGIVHVCGETHVIKKTPNKSLEVAQKNDKEQIKREDKKTTGAITIRNFGVQQETTVSEKNAEVLSK